MSHSQPLDDETRKSILRMAEEKMIERRDADSESESLSFSVDGWEITLGPVRQMSGPEFLAMLEAQSAEPDPNSHSLYVKIPEAILPVERGEKYDGPLDETLSRHGLGNVTGGGSMLKANKSIDYVGVDVAVKDLQKSLPLIAAKLREIGAPWGTVIQYGDEKSRTYDVWQGK